VDINETMHATPRARQLITKTAF